MHRVLVVVLFAALTGCEPTPAWPATRPWFANATETLLQEPNVLMWDVPCWLDDRENLLYLDGENNVVVLMPNPGLGHQSPTWNGIDQPWNIPHTQPLAVQWNLATETLFSDQILILEPGEQPLLYEAPPSFASRLRASLVDLQRYPAPDFGGHTDVQDFRVLLLQRVVEVEP